jgi:hypothetical protein
MDTDRDLGPLRQFLREDLLHALAGYRDLVRVIPAEEAFELASFPMLTASEHVLAHFEAVRGLEPDLEGELQVVIDLLSTLAARLDALRDSPVWLLYEHADGVKRARVIQDRLTALYEGSAGTMWVCDCGATTPLVLPRCSGCGKAREG